MPSTEFDQATEIQTLKQANQKLQAELWKAHQKKVGLIEAAREGAETAILALGKPPKVPTPKYRAAGDGKPEVAILHLSDWQTGKKTASFDSDVAEKRIEQLGFILEEITEIERGDHPVTECHLLLGGDFVEGVNIFPGQQWEIDSTLFEQTARASRMTTNLARHACRIFDKVHLWEEDGNHGRLGKKGEMPKGDNADRFTYRDTRLELADLESDGRVVWHERDSWYTLVTIGNYKLLLVHGDEIKQFGGNTPIHGIAKKVNAWAAGVTVPFHDCCMGHFHVPFVIPLAVGNRRVFVNSSIESDSVYAQEFCASNGFPAQRLMFVEPVRGRITSERLLWLE